MLIVHHFQENEHLNKLSDHQWPLILLTSNKRSTIIPLQMI